MGEVFGNSTYAISTVIAAYMAGLALGSWYGGKFNKKRSNQILYYLILEIGIGISALMVSLIILNIDNFYGIVYTFLNQNLTSLLIIRFLIGFILILLPTAFMGATLPTISKYIIRNFSKLGSDYSILYFVNTLGGLTGVVLSAFFMIEYFGLYITLFCAITLNILIGFLVYIIFYRSKRPEDLSIESELLISSSGSKPENSPTVFTEYNSSIILLTAFITGFTSFAYEILWTRSLVFFIGNSTYSYSLILIIFLFGIAAGSVLIKSFIDRIINFWKVIILTQSAIILFSILTIFLFTSFPHIDLFKPGHSNWINYLSHNLLTTSVIILIPAILMGITFPILNKLYINRIENVSNKVGNIYAVNTIGSIFGSLICGFILIPILGINRSIVFISLIIFVLVSYLIIKFFSLKKYRFFKFSLPVVFIISFVILFFINLPPFISYDEKDIEDIIFYEEGVSATTKVYLDPDGHKKMTVNGVLMGGDSNKAMRKQKMLAYLPLLLKQDVKDIYVVGLGTGATLVEFANFSGSAKIDCAEICPSVLNGSNLFFEDIKDLFSSPGVNILVEDGKNYLEVTDKKYDVISSDTMLKRGSAGNGIMYSKEYYDLCNQHLTDGGLFLQWVPLYLNEDIHKMVIRTALKSFSHTSLWYVGDEAMIQISSNKPLTIDYNEFKSNFINAEYFSSLVEIDFTKPESILSIFFMEGEELEAYVGEGKINSVINPYVEFQTPRDFESYKNVYLNISGLFKLKKSILDSPTILSTQNLSDDDKNSITRFVDSYNYIVNGLKYSYLNEVIKSKRMFTIALLRNPDDYNAKHYLGISESNNTDKRKARALLEHGIILSEMNEDSLAILIFRKSLSITPNNLLTLNKLSLSLKKDGRIGEAINIAQRMVKLDSNNFLANFNLGFFYEEAGRLKDALNVYEICDKMDPENKTIRQSILRVNSLIIAN